MTAINRRLERGNFWPMGCPIRAVLRWTCRRGRRRLMGPARMRCADSASKKALSASCSRVTTDSDHELPIFPNLARDMALDGPNQLRVADMTYIPIPAGFVYAAIIMDAWSRRIVGRVLGRGIDVRLTLSALEAALASRAPPEGCVHHSDPPNMPRSAIAIPVRPPAPPGPWGAAAIPMIMPRWRA